MTSTGHSGGIQIIERKLYSSWSRWGAWHGKSSTTWTPVCTGVSGVGGLERLEFGYRTAFNRKDTKIAKGKHEGFELTP